MYTIKEFKAGSYVNNKILIYGAGDFGELCLRCLQANQIEPYAFLDRRAEMDSYLSIKVLPATEIRNIDNPVVLLASNRYLKAMIDFLEENEISNYYSISQLLDTDIDESLLTDHAKEVWKNKIEYKKAVDDICGERLWVNNIDLVLTQYCNLKCRDCGSLMPYYKRPCHLDLDKLLASFDRFMTLADRVKELRLLGGETFLYPHLVQVVNHYKDNEKIDGIYLYTNAVMLPSEEVIEQIANEKTCIRISDYGPLSKNKEKLQELCQKHNLRCEVLDSTEWRDMGGVEKRNYTKEKLISVFEKCENAKCPSFCEGKLYICPRAAHMEKLGFFTNSENDVLDFTSDEACKEFTKGKIESFLFGREYFEACDYCNGNNKWENKIPAAIQRGRE